VTDTSPTMATDPWPILRRHTAARIGLGRAGDSVPTARLLEFEAAHARARDAVHAALDVGDIVAQLGTVPTITVPVVTVRSAAPDRAVYLQRPDLGRRLRPECAASLQPGDHDVVFVIADGLSATGVHDHAVNTLLAAMERLPGWRVAPVVIVTQARVAIGDEIGQRLGAAFAVVLIGERPGLSAADSVGIYLTAHPRIGRRDSERNCISNIHPPDGLGYADAADKLAYLLGQARMMGATGIGLKDDDMPALGPTIHEGHSKSS
jgi:ethanolamine ammonia-lyase small subunit